MIPELNSEEFEFFLSKVKSYKNILGLVLFGSFARGTQRPNSDIDLCIIRKDKSSTDSLFLEKIGDRKVDLVYFDKLSTQMQWKILLEAELIYSEDVISFQRLKIKKLNEYYDQKAFYERNLERLYAQI